MKKKAVKTLFSALILILSIFVISGCADNSDLEGESVSADTYAFVSKSIQNNYMQRLYEGFDDACREAGADSLYKAPRSTSAQEQIDIINELIDLKVTGIAVAANDADALTDVLQKAMESGIEVVSVDSAVRNTARSVHIQQANPEKIGRTLVSSAYDKLNGQGGIAILSSTEYATNQNQWIEYMKKEVEENQEKYALTPIIEIAYGDDDMMKSTTETQRILENPEIKAIIAPTAVGIVAAANVIRDTESTVKLVGLGMPSQMAEFIEDGTCQEMYLWNPVDAGYLAGCALTALKNGQITGISGDVFTAGRLGEKAVTNDIEGGTEIMLGDLLEFNKSNKESWIESF